MTRSPDHPQRIAAVRHRACRIVATSLLVVAGPNPLHAQTPVGTIDLAISSAPSPVGAGARATGIGSAFVALADDATAASWNPAGLVQLERPEISAVGAATLQIDDFGSADFSRDGNRFTKEVGTGEASSLDLNYLSAALPFTWNGRNLVASINYQQTLGFDRALTIHTTQVNADGATSDDTRHLSQDGAIYAISPALAAELTPELAIGATLSYWFDGIGRSYAWRIRAEQAGVFSFMGETLEYQNRESSVFHGVRGATGTFGALWRPLPSISIGAAGEVPFQATMSRDRTLDTELGVARVRDDVTLEYPASAALGVAYRASDALVLSADVTWVPWGDFRLIDEAENEFLISGDPVGDNDFKPAGSSSPDPHVDAVVTVRTGIEQLFRLDGWLLAVRSGVFYDPEPSRGAPENFWGCSAGIGATFSHFSVDVAYQFRFGLDVTGIALLRNVIEAPDQSIDIYRHSLYASLVYYL